LEWLPQEFLNDPAYRDTEKVKEGLRSEKREQIQTEGHDDLF